MGGTNTHEVGVLAEIWVRFSVYFANTLIAGNVDVMSCRQEPLKDMTCHVALTCRQDVSNL